MTKKHKPTERQKALLKMQGYVSKKNQMISCDCGCDVRGLTEYQLSAYRKNTELISYETYNPERKVNELVTVPKHFENSEHVWGVSLGYHDRKIKALSSALAMIRKVAIDILLTQELADSIEWFEVWGGDERLAVLKVEGDAIVNAGADRG